MIRVICLTFAPPQSVITLRLQYVDAPVEVDTGDAAVAVPVSRLVGMNASAEALFHHHSILMY